MSHLTDELSALHDHYVEAVNMAVADDDLDRAHALAAQYGDEALELISIHEGPTAALVHRLTHRPAA